MSLCNCNFKCSCTGVAVIASAIIGIIAAFFQITAVITITPVFLLAALAVAIVYLGLLLVSASLAGRRELCCGKCTILNALLAGILGTILFSAILLAVGIVATSVISAILVGVLLFFLALTIAATACFIRCLTDCNN